MVPILGPPLSSAPRNLATELVTTDYAPGTKLTVIRVVHLTDPFTVIFSKQPHFMHRNMIEDHRLKRNGRGKNAVHHIPLTVTLIFALSNVSFICSVTSVFVANELRIWVQ